MRWYFRNKTYTQLPIVLNAMREIQGAMGEKQQGGCLTDQQVRDGISEEVLLKQRSEG